MVRPPFAREYRAEKSRAGRYRARAWSNAASRCATPAPAASSSKLLASASATRPLTASSTDAVADAGADAGSAAASDGDAASQLASTPAATPRTRTFSPVYKLDMCQSLGKKLHRFRVGHGVQALCHERQQAEAVIAQIRNPDAKTGHVTALRHRKLDKPMREGPER